MPELRELTDDGDWDRAVPILRQLWSDREGDAIRAWRDDEGYRLLGWFVESAAGAESGTAAGAESGTGPDAGAADRLVAVAGGFVQTVLHHERGLWIHDFVVDEAHRGEGHGEALLRALEAWGEQHGCEHVGLACIGDNDEAAAFYEHVGMEAFGTVYEVGL